MNTENTNSVLVGKPPQAGRIGRYQLLDCLATGGMAQVFLALSGELSGFRRLVVVKRILPHLASDKHFIRMFFDEARLAALLDHPNIVRIIEVGQDGEEYFLAMEAVQGRSLSSLLRRGLKQDKPLTHAQSAFIMAQVANGLGHAHNLTDVDGRPLQVVHRDVSPQNILVSFDGNVKVIDFGVARALGRLTETRGGGLKGKIRYMSPEQTSGGQVDRRSDVFALGIVLWEALCGKRLFVRDNDLATLRAISDEPIPQPSEIVRISPRLERIVMRALERDPERRFQTAEEMGLALERHAFTTQGFNPLQIGTAMKELFASDHTRWRKTISTASALEGEPEKWANTSGTFLRPQTIDLHTRGVTVALRPHATPNPSIVNGRGASISRSRPPSTSGWSVPYLPPPKHGHWVGGIGLLLVAVAVGVFALAPSLPTIKAVGAVAGRVRPAIVEQLRGRAAVAPVAHTNTSAAAAATVPPMIEVTNTINPAATAKTEATTNIETKPPIETETETETKAQAKTEAKTETEAQTQTQAETETQPENEAETEPAPPATQFLAPAIAASEPRRPPPSAPPPRTARVKNRTPARTTTQRWSSSPPRSEAAASAEVCTLTIGTRPWSEVWIDGRNTGMHTPYSSNINCGNHSLTFKRADLGLNRSYRVQVYPGEPLKQSFSLD